MNVETVTLKAEIKLKQLRAFGLIVGGIFSIIGLRPLFLHSNDGPGLWALTIGGLLISQALLLPKTLDPVYRVWMKLGHVMGWLNTRLILALCFYGLITPIGYLIRLCGKDPMSRKIDPKLTTYRVVKSPRQASHMRQQF